MEDFPCEDWLTPSQAGLALRAAADKKNRGIYDPSWGLVILLNPIDFGVRQQAIEDLMADATAAVKERFASVWVLWKSVGYNTWRDGQTGVGKLVRHNRSVNDDQDT